MVLAIEQSLLPFVAILLVMTLYFTFLRRVTPETKAGKRRERFSQKLITPLPQTETARLDKLTQTGIAEPTKQPQTETARNEAELEETTKLPQTETAEVRAKPRREGLFKRTRKTKPTTTFDTKKAFQGKVPFCPKYLGYLGTLPKGSPYPDQCLGCRKVVTCIGLQRGEAIENMYLEEETVAR